MKKSVWMGAAVMSAFAVCLLSGCSSSKTETTAAATTTAAEAAAETTEEETSEAAKAEETGEIAMLDGPGMAKDLTKYADHFGFELVRDGQKATEKGILRAFNLNDEELWSYETEEYEMTELDRVQDVGEIYNGYCILAGGKVYNISTIGINAGQVEWVNEDFGGAGATWLIDDSDVLNTKIYLCGYYGPDLFEVDILGNTIVDYPELDYSELSVIAEDYYWPYDIQFTEDGMLDITFDSNAEVVTVDPQTGKAKAVRYLFPDERDGEGDEEYGDGSGAYVGEDGATTIIGTYYYHMTPMAWDEESKNPSAWEIKIEAGIDQTLNAAIDEESTFYPADGTGVLYEADVNFDGNMDLMILRGYFGVRAVSIYDCYINMGDHFEKCEGFDEIPDPVIDEEHQQITGILQDGYASYSEYAFQMEGTKAVLVSETKYEYDEKTKEFQKVN